MEYKQQINISKYLTLYTYKNIYNVFCWKYAPQLLKSKTDQQNKFKH